ncbi:pseudaminic acid synthase [bacterium]|nr:pseudaminic acid synthase [bacterium]
MPLSDPKHTRGESPGLFTPGTRSGRVEPLPISDRRVGEDREVFIVAELSGNHHSSLDTAKKLVRAAAESGADAVKLQTLSPDGITLDCDREPFRIGEGTIWSGRTLYDLYREVQTPWEWHRDLQQLAATLGLVLFSSPFDPRAVEFLERELDPPVYKVASFELVDIPLIEAIASTGKPIILSTGMGSEREVDEALEAAWNNGSGPLALLKCTSAYPAPPEEMNLRAIAWMRERFGVPTGLSDHSLTLAAPLTATAYGASIIEKHLILDRNEGGPDAPFSLEPAELARMVREVRAATRAAGRPMLGVGKRETASLQFRRSLFVVRDIAKGEELNDINVRSIRPGHGLPPRDLKRILGRRAATEIRRGTPLSWELIEGGEI